MGDYIFSSGKLIGILNGLFYYIPKNKSRFNYDRDKFVDFILNQKEKHPELFDNITITYTTLDNALFRMIYYRGEIEFLDLDNSVHIITPKSKENFENSRYQFKNDLLNQLEEISLDFQKEFIIQ